MTLSDLRQRVRDKSVLIFGIVVPLALMGVLNLVVGGAMDPELDDVTVAASVPEGDELGATLLAVLEEIQVVEVTVEQVRADQVRPRAESGEATIGVIVPDGFAGAVTAGQAVQVQVIEGDGAGLEGDVVIAVLQGVLDRMAAGAQAAHAAFRLGVPPAELATLAEAVAQSESQIAVVQGETAAEQLDPSASLVAGQAGLFLMFTVGFGVLGLLTEREQGTLARLRSMPMHPGLIVLAKGLVSFVLGVVATSILLTIGSLLFDVDFGSIAPVAVLIVCAVTATTSLMFTVIRVARTAEQAQIAQSILALVLGIAGGAFFPISATGAAAVLLDLNPVAAFIRGLGITAGGGGLADIGVPVATLLGFAVVAGAVSRLTPDRGGAL